MLNIVLPIAGRGSRFAQAGYAVPKPLIPVHGVPMVEVVVNNIRPTQAHRFIFLALQEHLDNTELRKVLLRAAPGATIVPVSGVTEGAACTVLLARDYIDNDDFLMIANSDQYVNTEIDAYLEKCAGSKVDGLVMTFPADNPKWSYVQCDPVGRVVDVVEKEVISHEATVGIYNFSRGSDFVRSADSMIRKGQRVNGEFYVAPVYNELIAHGASIYTFQIGREGGGMYGLGVPEDLNQFMNSDVSRKAAERCHKVRCAAHAIQTGESHVNELSMADQPHAVKR